MARALVFSLVLAALTSSALAQQEKPVLVQHQLRKNRVLSLWLYLKPCGVVIDYVHLARIREDGSVADWYPANRELVIIQWTHDLSTDLNYGAYDLLGDMGQTRYIMRVQGHSASGRVFTQNFWVSPAGVSRKPIKLAPLRDLDSPNFNEDDWKAFTNWYLGQHEFSSKGFLKQYQKIRWHVDRQVSLDVNIRGEECQQ